MASQDSDAADLLVIFGRTGDLHQMTPSGTLYRLQQRRLQWQQPWLSAKS
jgi:glucose-6-phosphate 1-dehydrogenase